MMSVQHEYRDLYLNKRNASLWHYPEIINDSNVSTQTFYDIQLIVLSQRTQPFFIFYKKHHLLGRCCSTFVLKHYWWENGEAEIEWRGIIINMWSCLNVETSHRCRQSSPALRLWSCWPGCPGGYGAAPPGSGSEAGAAWAEQPLLQAAVFPPDFHPDLQMTHDTKVIVYGCECDVKCLISAEFKSCWSAARWHQCNYTRCM